MDMAGKMSGIDMQGASGHEDARDLRNATGAAQVGVNSKAGELPEHVPLSGHGQVKRSSDRMQPARSPEPKWYQLFRSGHGARVRRLAASLVVRHCRKRVRRARPRADDLQRARPRGQDTNLDEHGECRKPTRSRLRMVTR